MDQYMNYQGFDISSSDQRPYRAPVNESFRSERDADRERAVRKSEVRRTASFHGGGAVDKQQPTSAGLSRMASDELNRLYSGKIPLYGQAGRRDISFMMDQVKEDMVKAKDSLSETKISTREIVRTAGSAGVQVCVGFFFAATHLTLLSHLVRSPLLTDSVNPHFLRIVFLVFSAVASACSAMLVSTVRYRKLVSSGAILLILSCLSASQVTNGRFMFLPYGVIAGSAHGMLRTVSMVAATDVSPHYRVTSVSCANLGHAVGGILGTFVYYFFMTDYLTPGAWTNNFRILELVAVVALLSGSVLPQSAVTSRRVGRVASDLGCHCLAIHHGLTFLAIGVLYYLIPVLPAERGFQANKFETFFNPLFAVYCGQWVGSFSLALTGSACGKAAARACLFIGGVVVFLLGVAVMPHDVAYQSFWAYMGLSFGLGLAAAFAQILVSVGVARRVGGAAVGVALSLLMFWQDVGTMVGAICVDELDSDFTAEVVLYMAGGVLLFTGLVFIACCYSVVPLRSSSRRSSGASDAEDDSSSAGEEGKGGIRNGGWNVGHEQDYRYMH
ncbi:uncharacterized protein LOC143290201 [Babylonia areolata]|uniref:uncharacterized protein LOC143290201 n=1 Tax=Babylonia areolata TaxID=304850 RepID=UPI003FD1623D